MSLLRFEGAVYWIGFTVAFLACAVWESFAPRRELSEPAERRWRNHGVMFVLNGAVSAILFRVSPVALALLVGGSRIGLLNRAWAPVAVRCVITVLLLDLCQYGIHWTLHHVPYLWRIHLVHHSDLDFDVSTAARHHPLEVIYTQAVRLGAIAALAPPAAGVFFAELSSMMLDVWTHSNAALPPPIDRVLRTIFFTPSLHRIHHSQELAEQQRNLGQIFPWWDRLLSSYSPKPMAEEGRFVTGVAGLDGQDSLGVGFMLAEPFQRSAESPSAPNPSFDSDAPAA